MISKPSHLGIITLPFEVTTSFLKGTGRGPSAILDELEKIDCFDFELSRNPFHCISRSIIEPHGPELTDPHIQQILAERAMSDLLSDGGFPLILGGEHTVSLGPIRAVRNLGPLGVVQLDAHADLRDKYEDNFYSHACVMRRVLEMDCSLLGIGLRAVSAEEKLFAVSQGLCQVDGRSAALSNEWYQLLDTLPERVYLSVDMDVFDPQEVRAVGTPEPGGPGYGAISDFICHLFEVKDVVAADIVELRPSEGDGPSIRLAARLAGLITGLIMADSASE